MGERIKLSYIRESQIKRDKEGEGERQKERQTERNGGMGEYEGIKEGRKVEGRIVVTLKERKKEKALNYKIAGFCLPLDGVYNSQ